MLVNKSGRRLVIGRINVRNGDALPGIPFTAGERKGIEKFLKKGLVVEVSAPEEEPALVVEAKAEAVAEAKAETVVEAKPEPAVEEKAVEQSAPKTYRRRRKLAEAVPEVAVKEDGVADND